MTPVDVPVGDILLEAMGYRGKARFVAIYFGAGDESYADDGQLSMTCDPHAYLAFIRHPACLELAGHRLGNSDEEAAELLVLDRQESRAYVAPVAEARRFLREQWQESAPTGPVTLSEADMQAVMDRLRREMESRPVPTPAEIMASLQEQYRLHRELVSWLDATPQATAGREAIRRMVEGDKGAGEKKEEQP